MRAAGAEGELEPALQRRHLLRIAPVGVVVGFDQPRLSNLVARKLVEAPILTVASLRYLERHGKPAHPSELHRHRCLQFLDPYSGQHEAIFAMRLDFESPGRCGVVFPPIIE